MSATTGLHRYRDRIHGAYWCETFGGFFVRYYFKAGRWVAAFLSRADSTLVGEVSDDKFKTLHDVRGFADLWVRDRNRGIPA